jgi:hypothetical protein
MGQHVGQAGAEGRAAAVAHVQGAGGIGGDEFDLDLLALLRIAAAEAFRGAQDVGGHALPGRRA